MKFVLFITLTTKNKKMEIFNLIQNNSINQIEQFIHNCADVNAKDKYGYTPLMAALWCKNNKDIIQLLLDNGARVNAIDNHNDTPLILALIKKIDKDIIQLLLDNGADDALETLQEKINESDYKTEMLLFIEEYYNNSMYVII